jgi:probable F420-dependent oxidoreductase
VPGVGACEIGLVQAFDGSAKYGPAYARDFAQAAEALGFHSLWVPEHIVFFEHYESQYPYPPEPGSDKPPQLPVGARPALFDPLLTCQALAMHTTTLRVGTAVALVPLRHPLLWAREVSTLDHFSGGRFELGVGVGWLAEEFDALGVPFGDRGRVADEHLAALRALWTQDATTFHGAHVDFTDAVSFPKPLQAPGPPVLIGGESNGALRRVARYGDGWYPWNLTPAQLDHGLERLDAALAGHPFLDGTSRGRDDVAVQVGLRFLGPLDQLAELVDGYTALGAGRVVAAVAISSSSFEARLGEVAEALGVAPTAS